MLTTALVESGKLRVLERQQIHDVLGERDLGAFQKTTLREATREAIEKTVRKILSDFGTENVPEPAAVWSGSLLIADDGSLSIRAGTNE